MSDKFTLLHDIFFGVLIPVTPLFVGLLGYWKVSSGHNKKWREIITFAESIIFVISVVLSGISSSALSFAATVCIFTSIAGLITVLSAPDVEQGPTFNAGFIGVINAVLCVFGLLIAILKWVLIQ